MSAQCSRQPSQALCQRLRAAVICASGFRNFGFGAYECSRLHWGLVWGLGLFMWMFLGCEVDVSYRTFVFFLV